MKSHPFFAVAGLLAVMPAPAAPAQTPVPARQPSAEMQQRMEQRWKTADKNGDGFIDKAEADAGLPRIAKNFDLLDADRDGRLSPGELRAAMQKLAAARQSQGR